MILYYNVYIISDSYRLKNTITHSNVLFWFAADLSPPLPPPPPLLHGGDAGGQEQAGNQDIFLMQILRKKVLFCQQVWPPCYLVPD